MIIGLYGCYCHPFESWDECEKFNKQKLQVGDKVKHRCKGLTGEVLEIQDKKWILLEGFGLEHCSNVIFISRNEMKLPLA